MNSVFKKTIAGLLTGSMLLTFITTTSYSETTPNSEAQSQNHYVQISPDDILIPLVSNPSLSSPGIIEPRAINPNYSRMNPPIVEAYSNNNGTNTGYMNISWEPILGATGYQLIFFNGHKHQYITVGKDVTSWSSQDKAIFPKEDHIEVGNINFRNDKTGQDFPIDPSVLYKKAYELYGGVNYSSMSHYYVRITALHDDGAHPISYATPAMIPLDTPSGIKGINEITDNSQGSISLTWNPVKNATGYKVWIFNGKEFESFDVGSETTWSTMNKKLWPTNEEIVDGRYELHIDETGTELPLDPSSLYKNSGNLYSDNINYWFRVTAYNDKNNVSYFSSPYVSTFMEELPGDMLENVGEEDDTLSEFLGEDYPEYSDITQVQPRIGPIIRFVIVGGAKVGKHVYKSIKYAPKYPAGFKAVQNGTKNVTVKDKKLLSELRQIESGDWKKVYKDGYIKGKKASIHYFQSKSGLVFDVKTKQGWSVKK